MLTIDTIPLCYESRVANLESCTRKISRTRLQTHDSRLFILSVYAVATAAIAELFKLKPSRRVLFVLGRRVVALFALSALQNNVISWHINLVGLWLSDFGFRKPKTKYLKPLTYKTTSETVPAPTVRPPSRIAKRSPFSIAIGAISSISIAMLSPGITISTPAGRCATPVTSVVLK